MNEGPKARVDAEMDRGTKESTEGGRAGVTDGGRARGFLLEEGIRGQGPGLPRRPKPPQARGPTTPSRPLTRPGASQMTAVPAVSTTSRASRCWADALLRTSGLVLGRDRKVQGEGKHVLVWSPHHQGLLREGGFQPQHSGEGEEVLRIPSPPSPPAGRQRIRTLEPREPSLPPPPHRKKTPQNKKQIGKGRGQGLLTTAPTC